LLKIALSSHNPQFINQSELLDTTGRKIRKKEDEKEKAFPL